MDLVNATVSHAQFGAGQVTGFDGSVLTVDFAGIGSKRFVYPTAFEKFLKLDNPELATQVSVDLVSAQATQLARQVLSVQQMQQTQQFQRKSPIRNRGTGKKTSL